MPMTIGQIPCAVILIDSYTLQIMPVRLSADVPGFEKNFSFYSIINNLSTVNRRRLIIALKTHSNYNCSLLYNNTEYSVGLYSIDRSGAQWSHVLTLSRADFTRNKTHISTAMMCTADLSSDFYFIQKTLEDLVICYHTAMLICDPKNPFTVKKYVDMANQLEDSLRKLIGNERN